MMSKTVSDSPATIVFKVCSFTGCAVSMSSQATVEKQSVLGNSIEELLKGINMDDIFDD